MRLILFFCKLYGHNNVQVVYALSTIAFCRRPFGIVADSRALGSRGRPISFQICCVQNHQIDINFCGSSASRQTYPLMLEGEE